MQAADQNQNGYVNRKEFRLLLEYLIYFNNVWDKFTEIDGSTGEVDDRRLTIEEFKQGCAALDEALTDEEAVKEFQTMDANGGGVVLFEEFCAWIAKRQLGVAAPLDEATKLFDKAKAKARKKQNVFEYLRICFRTNLELNGESVSDTRKLFSSLDTDGSGALDPEEFSGAMEQLGISLSDAQSNQVFSKMDPKKTGVISYQSFIEKMYEDTFEELRKAMRASRKVNGLKVCPTPPIPCRVTASCSSQCEPTVPAVLYIS